MNTTYHQKEDEEIEIDLMELVSVLISRLWLIVMVGVILALVAIIGTKLFITPQYKSETKMYVLNRQSTDTLTSSDLQSGTLLTQDYAEMIQSRTVAESVISELGLDLTPEELIAKISVDTSGDSTRVLTITVTDEDPYTARDIADTVREMAAEQIKNVMNIEAVNVVDKANVPDQPYSPSVKKNGVLGGLLGILISAAIIVLMHLMNDTIKTAEDVEKYLGMSTLGTIPLTKGTADSKPKKRRKAADVKTAKRSKKS